MNDTVQNLADLDQLSAEGAAPEAQPAAPTYEPVRDEFGRSYATGKRKNAIARVWVKPVAESSRWPWHAPQVPRRNR